MYRINIGINRMDAQYFLWAEAVIFYINMINVMKNNLIITIVRALKTSQPAYAVLTFDWRPTRRGYWDTLLLALMEKTSAQWDPLESCRKGKHDFFGISCQVNLVSNHCISRGRREQRTGLKCHNISENVKIIEFQYYCIICNSFVITLQTCLVLV